MHHNLHVLGQAIERNQKTFKRRLVPIRSFCFAYAALLYAVYLKDMGYNAVRLDTFTENPFAQRLYRHNGYESRGYADWRKGRFDLMEKAL